MPKANLQYDLSFLDQSDNEVGLMLAEDSKGLKVYKETDDPTLANQYFSGAPSYANLPPEKEVQIAQFDWRAGSGQEFFDSYDPKRYWYTGGMDLRFKGKVILPPKRNSATLPNAGFVRIHGEYQDDLYIGLDSHLCRLNGVGTQFGSIKDLSNNITDLEEFTDGNLYIALGDGNKYYYMDKAELVVHSCEAAWDELVDGDVTASRDNTSGYVMNGTYAAIFVVAADCGAGDILATDSMTSTDLSSYTDISFWIYSSVALTSGDLQLLLDDSANCASPLETLDIPAVSAETWTMVNMAFVTPTNLTAVISIGLKMVVDKGAFDLWVDDIRAASFTESTLSDGDADYFQTVDTTLWKATSVNELKSSSDPTNSGSWSTAYTVGSDSDSITALLEESRQLYICKEDMVYYMDTDNKIFRLIPELAKLKSSTNGANSIVWNKKLYIPWGTDDLVEYDLGSVNWRSISLYDPSSYGNIEALTADERYIFACVPQVLAGRMEEIDGVNRWVWHTLVNSGLDGVQYSFVSNVYKKRLYLADGAGSLSVVYYYSLPTNYGQPWDDTDYEFEDTRSCYFYTSWYDANLRGDPKAYIKVTAHLEDTSTNNYFKIKYRKFGDPLSTNIGDFKTSPATTKYIPADASGNDPSSTNIRFYIVGYTGDSSRTPKLLGIDCRGVWYPTKRRLIECRIKVADNLTLKNGLTVDKTQTAADIKAAIDEANETATYPFTFYDIMGASLTVKILEADYHLAEVGKDKNKEWVYDLLIEKVTTS